MAAGETFITVRIRWWLKPVMYLLGPICRRMSEERQGRFIGWLASHAVYVER